MPHLFVFLVYIYLLPFIITGIIFIHLILFTYRYLH